MKDSILKKVNTDPLKAFINNAAADISDTLTEAQIPIASDQCVEEARDWVNDGSKL